jgi:hypothetical protein
MMARVENPFVTMLVNRDGIREPDLIQPDTTGRLMEAERQGFVTDKSALRQAVRREVKGYALPERCRKLNFRLNVNCGIAVEVDGTRLGGRIVIRTNGHPDGLAESV